MYALIFDKVIDFFLDGLIKFITRLPASPFSFDDYKTALHDYLPFLNWFIPFYQFEVILGVWQVMFVSAITIFFIIKWVSHVVSK